MEGADHDRGTEGDVAPQGVSTDKLFVAPVEGRPLGIDSIEQHPGSVDEHDHTASASEAIDSTESPASGREHNCTLASEAKPSRLHHRPPQMLPETDYAGLHKKQIIQRCVSYPLDASICANRTIGSEVDEDNEEKEKKILDRRVKGLNHFMQENSPLAGESLKNFHIQANQLFIFGRVIDYCPLCFTVKGEHAARSHIFPETLLRAYKAIHCGDAGEFILDSSDGKILGAHALTFPLFCNTCEGNASNEENLLKSVYLQIQSSVTRLRIKDIHKFKHVLAILMFRGILLGVNFLEEITRYYFHDFLETFMELQEYCRESDVQVYKEKAISKRIHLSLVRNVPFNPNNIDPCYILDLQLRNPEFTSVVVLENAVFFYTKFDCFHCTLPISPKDIISLNEKSCFKCPMIDNFYLLPAPREAVDAFPKLLLDVSLSKMMGLSYSLVALNNSPIISCQCVIQKFKIKKWEPRICKPGKAQLIMQSSDASFIDIKTNIDDKECMKEAHKNSPLVKFRKQGIQMLCADEISEGRSIAKRKWKIQKELAEKNQQINKLVEGRKKLIKESHEAAKKWKQERERLLEEIAILKGQKELHHPSHERQDDPIEHITSI
jgi:hypothetical protein